MKVFTDELLTPQRISPENSQLLFKKDCLDVSNRFIVLYTGTTPDRWSWQAFLQDIHLVSNNYYAVLLYSEREEIVAMGYVHGCTVLPPVWEKMWGGDYEDWLNIQAKVNEMLAAVKKQPIEVQTDTKGKMRYFVKDPDAMEKVQKGEIYEIVSLTVEASETLMAKI